MPSVAIYARVSVQDKEEKGKPKRPVGAMSTSCVIQLEELRAWARRHEWNIYREYVDDGVSGKLASRPELDRLMADARARRFDIVIVLKVDRFGRSMLNGIQNIKELSQHGIRFIAISQNIDTDKSSPMGNLTLNIMLAFAEFEREMIVERTVAGIAHAAKNGTKSGRPSGRQPKVFDRGRARELYHHERWSYRKIAAEMKVSVGVIHKVVNGIS